MTQRPAVRTHLFKRDCLNRRQQSVDPVVLVLLLMKPPAAALRTHHDVQDNMQGESQIIPYSGALFRHNDSAGCSGTRSRWWCRWRRSCSSAYVSLHTEGAHEAFKSVSVLRYSCITQSALCVHMCVCVMRTKCVK